MLSPVLKWAGGKRWLVPYVKKTWIDHAHRRLVEPFCGGLAMALGLNPGKALLNDINPHLINLYQWVQRGMKLDLTEKDHAKDVYYRSRRRFNDLIGKGAIESREAAILFYYLNRTGFNGLCRFNSKGEYNVPFGSYKRVKYMTTKDFQPYTDAFHGWHFQSGDFRNMELDDNDFVYADPPYDMGFTKYTKQDFTWEDQVGLAEWLGKHPGPVILSNKATERIVTLYTRHGFDIYYYDAPRRISRTGDRTPEREVVAVRNATWKHQKQGMVSMFDQLKDEDNG